MMNLFKTLGHLYKDDIDIQYDDRLSTPGARPCIAIIAGEPSGDVLGGKLMRSLKAYYVSQGVTPQFVGVGGAQMTAEGMESLFPMQEIALFGVVEIVPHLRRVLRHIEETTDALSAIQPDAVITIDAPGFNTRLVKGLKGLKCLKIHYVAPTVWAYKPGRSKLWAKLFDHLLVLLPFEPPYFTQQGLPTTFVGHPVVEDPLPEAEACHQFKVSHPASPSIVLLPGSRMSELARIGPIFRQTIRLLMPHYPELAVIIPTLPHLRATIEAYAKDFSCPVTIVDDPDHKAVAMASATVALAKSGTASLELARLGVPCIVAYRINPLSAWMLKRVMRTRWVNLVNIVLQKEVVPEYLQSRCTPPLLAEAMQALIDDPAIRSAQLAAIGQAMHLLRQNETPCPSDKAAETVARLIEKRR